MEVRVSHHPVAVGELKPLIENAGEVLVKSRRESSKTRDITGGLPRVAELFEARKPKDAAIVAEIDGTVEYVKVTRGMREYVIRGEGHVR